MELVPISLPIEIVLHIVEALRPKYNNVLVSPSHPITQTLLSFTLVCHATRRVANRALLQHCIYLSSKARLRSFLLTASNRPGPCKIEALFLSPFDESGYDHPTATSIRDLFAHVFPSLRRLIIDIPLLSLRRGDGSLGARQVLRDGLSRLENLEEFVSVHKELPFRDHSGNWTRWPNLRRLALFNVAATPKFWADIAAMARLETLVLTCADTLATVDVKREYFRFSPRPLKVLVVNVASEQLQYSHMTGRRSWDRIDPHKIMTLMTYDVPTFFEEDSVTEVCQEFVKAGAENGTLWEWEGDIIPHPPRVWSENWQAFLD
ncbi:hypothetical protein B0J11DRAFT_344941 [Dendryphion nanum]|uniref:Uncharacterized protein n=1 Tax=Dendryphion nanum TaxID=256645 RepID=A0A9P9DNS6_9PLEO|nr:hypothetical protein B0J11DRAFT_344941 [Dendryphion nanum]